MRSAFETLHTSSEPAQITSQGGNEPGIEKIRQLGKTIQISIEADGEADFRCELLADEDASYPKLKELTAWRISDLLASLKSSSLPGGTQVTPADVIQRIEDRLRIRTSGALPEFLIFAPENSALRTFQAEGQILPLGVKGEGLFAHLKRLSNETHREQLLSIQESLTLIDWFESFEIPHDLGLGERSLWIRDRYLRDGALFDQRSANEGFLFLLFYITLFVSPETPRFFAIDNVDSSLNPKLCIALMQQIVALAREHDKQVILTTHNPAVLDGLDLDDPEQRLLVVDRNKAGHSRVRRIAPPKQGADEPAVSLSEAFLRGYIGGLPKNF